MLLHHLPNMLRVIASILVIPLGLMAGGRAMAQQPEDPALTRLNSSPRHLEWIEVTRPDGRVVHAFIAYPETSKPAMAVIVIHEIFGMTDWVRSVADQVAEAGYIAIAPDLLSGMGPGGGRSSDFPSVDAARSAVSELDGDQVIADLQAVADYVKGLDACNGEIAVGGFCWGGTQTWRFAVARNDLKGAFPFYGTAPEELDQLRRIACPVYGFYGGNDARVTATVTPTTERMREVNKPYEPEIYAGAGHGFMRAGTTAPEDNPNRTAMQKGWERWKKLLAEVSKADSDAATP